MRKEYTFLLLLILLQSCNDVQVASKVSMITLPIADNFNSITCSNCKLRILKHSEG